MSTVSTHCQRYQQLTYKNVTVLKIIHADGYMDRMLGAVPCVHHSVCLSILSLKVEWLELSTLNLVDVQ